ncbi:MAG: universal stress protein [Nitriliruptorales bacterium]|nr:universal stress protein [Nitriliruptorales bacterium]
MSEILVVGVDGSDNADEALRWALDYARGRGATIRLTTAWAWEEVVGPPGARFPVETREEAETRADHLLDEVVERVSVGEVQVERVRKLGRPSEVLLAEADDADLLVVGSRGRGGFAGLLLGSVSQQCVTHAPCPVVVVPPRGG